MTTPSTNGANGRDANGRFASGNAGGPGNPNARRSAELRQAVLDAVSADDIAEVIRKLIEMAKSGDPAAIKELLNRVIGRPAQVAAEDSPFSATQPIRVILDDDWYGNADRLRASDTPVVELPRNGRESPPHTG